jgi:hypothetical protein
MRASARRSRGALGHRLAKVPSHSMRNLLSTVPKGCPGLRGGDRWSARVGEIVGQLPRQAGRSQCGGVTTDSSARAGQTWASGYFLRSPKVCVHGRTTPWQAHRSADAHHLGQRGHSGHQRSSEPSACATPVPRSRSTSLTSLSDIVVTRLLGHSRATMGLHLVVKDGKAVAGPRVSAFSWRQWMSAWVEY